MTTSRPDPGLRPRARTPRRVGLVTLLATVFLAGAVRPGRAGVIVETRLDLGMMGGAGTGSGKVEIEGGRRRESRSVTLTGDAAGPAPGAESDAITRLDRGVQWQLDHDARTYRETPLDRLSSALEVPGGFALPGLTPGARASISWAVDVTRRADSERIAGYRARRTDITLTGTARDPDTGARTTIRLVTQWWMSREAPGAAEITAFERGFERATHGLSPDIPGLLEGLPGASDAVARFERARRGLAGVPLRTVLEVDAPGLLSQLGTALQGGAGEGVGGDQGAPAPSPSPAPKAPDEESAEPLVRSTIEVTSIRVARIAPARFELPGGYARAAPDTAPREEHE